MTKNKNQIYEVKYASELLKISEGDLQTALALIGSVNPGRLENILYMIQQSVEKAIKSVLIKKVIAFPMVHDLGILIALLPVSDYPPGGFDWNALNPYASIRRYEEGPIALTPDEISSSYKAALLVILWAKKYN